MVSMYLSFKFILVCCGISKYILCTTIVLHDHCLALRALTQRPRFQDLDMTTLWPWQNQKRPNMPGRHAKEVKVEKTSKQKQGQPIRMMGH